MRVVSFSIFDNLSDNGICNLNLNRHWSGADTRIYFQLMFNSKHKLNEHENVVSNLCIPLFQGFKQIISVSKSVYAYTFVKGTDNKLPNQSSPI